VLYVLYVIPGDCYVSLCIRTTGQTQLISMDVFNVIILCDNLAYCCMCSQYGKLLLHSDQW